MSDNTLVKAATFTNSFDANLALTILRDNDIPCILDGETISDVWGGNQSMPFSGITLMVNAGDADRVSRLLADIARNEAEPQTTA